MIEESALREEIREAINGLDAGETSELIETPSAYIIVQVAELEPRKAIPLEEISDRVMNDLNNDMVAKGMDELIKRYKRESFIEIKSEQFAGLYDRESTNLGG
jgi:parvulin-like peptidyl-prolyl isomerase